jgi:hypothetical protein
MARGSAWKRTRTQVLHLTIFFFFILLLIAPLTATCVALAAGFAFLLVAGALVLPATVRAITSTHRTGSCGSSFWITSSQGLPVRCTAWY